MAWKDTRTNFTRNLAVVIAVDHYENKSIRDLSTPVNDASAIADLLETDYAYKQDDLQTQVIRLFNKQATLAGIRDLLTKTLPQLALTDGDRVIFYFAGHGLPRTNEDAPEGYLVPQDADPAKPDSFLPMREVAEELSKLACHHLLLILDCCFAGTFRWVVPSRDLIPVLKMIHREHYYRFIRYPAWQLITSSAHDQEALDVAKLNQNKRDEDKIPGYDDKLHSPFALALLEGLQHSEGAQRQNADLIPDGVVTAYELFTYLEQRVSQLSKERQTPGLYPLRQDYDKGQFIFTSPKFDPEKQLEPAPKLNEENNPYRGLKSFDEKHAQFFFGRQVLVEALIKRLCQPKHTLQVVLGVSGSGKSSLVKAGLLPRLRVDKSPWYILEPMRPQASPFMALARVLLPVVNPTLIEQLAQVSFLDEKLKQVVNQPDQKTNSPTQATSSTAATTDPLHKVAANWGSAQPEAKLLLIEDYFAQLQAQCSLEEQRSLTALHQALLSEIDTTVQQLQQNPHYLSHEIQKWSQAYPNTTLLLVIDQFEELITMSQSSSAENRGATQAESNGTSDLKQLPFLKTLREAIATCPQQWRVVVTLRSDFEPRFLDSPLQAYWQAARFPVRAMNSDELRQAIEGPALKQALYFEPDNLVGMLIDEVGQMPGALPLLSFTLSELYVKLHERWIKDESTDRALRMKDYEGLGGIAGALSQRATEEYKSQKWDDLQRATMRRVMLRMVTIEGSGIARRRVPESELEYPSDEENQRREKVINQLVNIRLLVKGQETGRIYIEPAHDFLLRWNKLQEWIEQEQEDLALQQRLIPAANDWKNNRGKLWIEEADRLARLEEVLESETANWLNRLEQEFVTQSILERQNRIKKLEEDLRISEERRLAAELELSSVIELRQFEIEKGIVPLQNATRIAHELLEWVQKNNRTLRDYPTASPLFTLQTILDRLYEHEHFFYSQETDAFWNWLTKSAVPETIPAQFETGHGESLLIPCPNGQYFITIETEVAQPNRYRWRIWQQPQEPLTDLLETEIEIDPAYFYRSGNAPRFSESGKIIVLKSFSVAEFYNLAGDLLGKFSASPGFSINQITVSPDDSKIAIIELLGGGEGTQRLHFMAQYRQTKETSRFQRNTYFYIDEVSYHRVYGSMRFTADSQFLVTADSQNTNVHPVRVWHLEPHICLKLADSEQLLTVPLQRNLEFRWQQGKAECLDQDQIIAVLEGQEDWFKQIILSPQQTWLVSIDRTYSVRLWKRSGTLIANFAPYRGASLGRRVFLSPNDNYCALVDRTGVNIISLVDIFEKSQANPDHFLGLGMTPEKSSISQIQGSFNQFFSLSFSPDEEKIVAVGMERTIRVWDLKARQLAELNLTDPQIARIVGAPLDMGDGFDPKVVFSLDGQWIIFTGKNRGSTPTLIWQVETLGDLIERSRKRSSDYWQDEIGKKIKRLVGGIETQTQ
ncbi:caspase family protein [Microcoleus sp. F8_C2]